MAIIETKKTEKENKAKKSKKKDELPIKGSVLAYDFLLEPWVTEKSHESVTMNKYFFKVTKSATKTKLKRAIAELYQVQVEDINIVNIPPKKRNFRRNSGFKSGFKKAIITLKEGDKIELFKGI